MNNGGRREVDDQRQAVDAPHHHYVADVRTSAQVASQSSPFARTCPVGRQVLTTSAGMPIIASAPVCGRQRRAGRRAQVISTTSTEIPPITTTHFTETG